MDYALFCCYQAKTKALQVNVTPGDRRQRNRQVQAALLESRAAYTRHLEHIVHVHNKTILALQTANRTTHHEVLRLRYRNYVLESALSKTGLSKTCDSQTPFPFDWHSTPSLGVRLPTELRTETSNSALPSNYMPHNTLQSSPTAGHHQPQLFNSRIASNFETMNPQQTGACRKGLGSEQAIQQPPQLSFQQVSTANEFSHHTTSAFQNQAGQWSK